MQLLPQSIRHEQRGSVCFLPLSRQLDHCSSFEITASRPCTHSALRAGIRIDRSGCPQKHPSSAFALSFQRSRPTLIRLASIEVKERNAVLFQLSPVPLQCRTRHSSSCGTYEVPQAEQSIVPNVPGLKVPVLLELVSKILDARYWETQHGTIAPRRATDRHATVSFPGVSNYPRYDASSRYKLPRKSGAWLRKPGLLRCREGR